jgi:hypothetical protein
MIKRTILRRLEALEKLERPPGTIVTMNLEGEKAKPENVIKYLGKIDENGNCQAIGSVIADQSEY